MKREQWESGEAGAALGDWLLEQLGFESSEGRIARDPELRRSVEAARARLPQNKGDLMSIDWGSLLGAGMTMYRDTRRPAGQTPYYLESPMAPTMTADQAYRAAQYPHRRRRMNPMNARAARRAVRRLKSVRKLLQSIERGMPKRTVKSHPFRRRR